MQIMYGFLHFIYTPISIDKLSAKFRSLWLCFWACAQRWAKLDPFGYLVVRLCRLHRVQEGAHFELT